MTELAKAYVQIIPTTKDIGSNLSSELSGELNAAGQSGGKSFASGFGGAAKGAVTAIAGVTAATTALSTAVVKSASDTAAYGDNIDKMSQKMGMSGVGRGHAALRYEHGDYENLHEDAGQRCRERKQGI